MSRRSFIESFGATCRNWTWSWSFVNHEQHFVIMGVWDVNLSDGYGLLIQEESRFNRRTGRVRPGFVEAEHHLQLVLHEGYSLKVFPQRRALVDPSDPTSKSKILGFDSKLVDAELYVHKGAYFAAFEKLRTSETDEAEIHEREFYLEGNRKTVLSSRVERSFAARAACIENHGCICQVCGMDFSDVYGSIGLGFIHVHHILPLSESNVSRSVDPKTDLVPVCPNCHAMLHKRRPPFTVEELKEKISLLKNLPCTG